MKTLLNQRRDQLKEAQDNYLDAMQKAYPLHTDILFYRHPNQTNPYTGRVCYVGLTYISVLMGAQYKKQYWHIRHDQVA